MGTERCGAQKDLDIAVDQLPAQLAGSGERGKRHNHGADSRRGEHPDDKAGSVRIEQSYMGSLAGTEGG